jgi:TRAP-type C4-dicarboxylate transport system substrate-binding protein
MKLHKTIPAGLMLVLLTAFCLFGPEVAVAEVIELSYSSVFPPTHIHAKLGESWIKEIESRTQGRMKINFYPGGALLKGDKMYSGVQTGISDIGMSVFVYNRGMYPVMEIVDLPLGFTSGKMGTTVINEIYKKFPPKKLDQEVKVLYLHAHGPGLLHTKKPIASLEDIKGLKIRGQGATARIIESLGAVPVAMPQAQSYEALQKGVVEGNFSPMEVLKGWRQADVVNNTTLCYGVGYSSTFYLIMNKRKWDALPADIQKIFEEVDTQWSINHADAWDQVDQEAKEFATAMGHQIITLSDEENERWKRAVQPAIDEYIASAKKKGLPGELYVETAKDLIRNYK